MAFCDRCACKEITVECRQCADTADGVVYYCDTCSKILHFSGALARHELKSCEGKLKREDTMRMLSEYTSHIQSMNMRKEEVEGAIENIHEQQRIFERSLRESVYKAQEMLMNHAKKCRNVAVGIIKEKEQYLHTYVEEYKCRINQALEVQESVEKTLVTSEDSEVSWDDVKTKLNTDGLYILNYALPSLYIDLPVIDYTSVIEAINNMDLTNNSNVEEKMQCLSTLPCPVEEGAETLLTICSHLSNKGTFWAVPNLNAETSHRLNTMNLDIRTKYINDPAWKTYSESGTIPKEGELVYAQYQMDRKWYRGQIENLQDNECEIRFIDYGSTHKTGFDRILPLTYNLFPGIDPQAVNCCLFDEEREESLHHEARWHFGNITGDFPVNAHFKKQITVDGDLMWYADFTYEESGEIINIREEIEKKSDGITKRLDGVITCTDVRLIDNPNLKFNSTSISPSFDTRNENDCQTCSDSSIKYENSDDNVLSGDSSSENPDMENEIDIVAGLLVDDVLQRSAKIISGTTDETLEVPHWGIQPEIHISDELEADHRGFDVPVHGKEDADYGYFLNVNAPPFELNESTGFSPGKSDNIEFPFGETKGNVPQENPIGDQFTTAVKDLMAENFLEGKFGTIAGIDPDSDRDEKGKRGTGSEFHYPLLPHYTDGSEGIVKTEMPDEDSVAELHFGQCQSKVLERRTHFMRTDTYTVNESPDNLACTGADVSGFENTDRKTLVRADTYVVDDDGEIYHFDTNSFGETGRAPYNNDEVNQRGTTSADTETACEGRSSYMGQSTAESGEEEIIEADDTEAKNCLGLSGLSPSKDVLESANALVSATVSSSKEQEVYKDPPGMSNWKESLPIEKCENETGGQFVKKPSARDSLGDIVGTEAIFRGGDDKEAQIESNSNCDNFKNNHSVMMQADEQEYVVRSVVEETGIIEDKQFDDSKGILASAKLFTGVNNELTDDTCLQKEQRYDASVVCNIISGHESDTVIHTHTCEAEQMKSEAEIFRSVPDASKEQETVEYVTSGRAILGSGGYTFPESDQEDDALQAECVEGQTLEPDFDQKISESQSTTFLNSANLDEYDQETRGPDFKGATEDVERPISRSDIVASTLWEGMERDCEIISDLEDNGSFYVRILDEETPEQRQKFQEELNTIGRMSSTIPTGKTIGLIESRGFYYRVKITGKLDESGRCDVFLIDEGKTRKVHVANIKDGPDKIFDVVDKARLVSIAREGYRDFNQDAKKVFKAIANTKRSKFVLKVRTVNQFLCYVDLFEISGNDAQRRNVGQHIAEEVPVACLQRDSPATGHQFGSPPMAVYPDIHMLNQLQVTQMSSQVRNAGSLPCLDPRLAVDAEGRIPCMIPTVQENQYSRSRSAATSPADVNIRRLRMATRVPEGYQHVVSSPTMVMPSPKQIIRGRPASAGTPVTIMMPDPRMKVAHTHVNARPTVQSNPTVSAATNIPACVNPWSQSQVLLQPRVPLAARSRIEAIGTSCAIQQSSALSGVHNRAAAFSHHPVLKSLVRQSHGSNAYGSCRSQSAQSENFRLSTPPIPADVVRKRHDSARSDASRHSGEDEKQQRHERDAVVDPSCKPPANSISGAKDAKESETAEPTEVRSKESATETTPVEALRKQEEKDQQDGVQSKKTYANTVKIPTKATGQPRMGVGKVRVSGRLKTDSENSQDEQHSSPIGGGNKQAKEVENENTSGNSGSRVEHSDTILGRCYGCHEPGHIKRNCPKSFRASSSSGVDFARNKPFKDRRSYSRFPQGTCYSCGDPNHYERECPLNRDVRDGLDRRNERSGRSGFSSPSKRNVGQKRSQDKSVQGGSGDQGNKSTKSRKRASHVEGTEEEW